MVSGGQEAQEVFSRLKALGAEGPAYRTDQALMGTVPEADAQQWADAWSQIMEDPAQAEALASCYAELDALVSAEPDDPRVPALADQIWNLIPQEYLSTLAPEGLEHAETPVVAALAESMSPAQAKVMELLMQRLSTIGKSQ